MSPTSEGKQNILDSISPLPLDVSLQESALVFKIIESGFQSKLSGFVEYKWIRPHTNSLTK